MKRVLWSEELPSLIYASLSVKDFAIGKEALNYTLLCFLILIIWWGYFLEVSAILIIAISVSVLISAIQTLHIFLEPCIYIRCFPRLLSMWSGFR